MCGEVGGMLCDTLKLHARQLREDSCREKYGVWIDICKAFKAFGLLYTKTGLCDCYWNKKQVEHSLGMNVRKETFRYLVAMPLNLT